MRCYLIVLVLALTFLLTNIAFGDNVGTSTVTAHYGMPELSISVPDTLDFPMDITSAKNVKPFFAQVTSSAETPWHVTVDDVGTTSPKWYLRNETGDVHLTNPISVISGSYTVPNADPDNLTIASGSSTYEAIPVRLEQVPNDADDITELYLMSLQFTIYSGI